MRLSGLQAVVLTTDRSGPSRAVLGALGSMLLRLTYRVIQVLRPTKIDFPSPTLYRTCPLTDRGEMYERRI